MLYIHSQQLVSWGKAIHLASCNGLHQSAFTSTIGSAQPVAAPTLEDQPGIIEENLTTCLKQVGIGKASQMGHF
jgi:hypothetical protein